MSKLRNELRNGIRWQPLAFFVQRHHGHARDRLGHGVVAEDRVLGHGRAAGHVSLAKRAIVHNLPVARQDGHNARHLLLVHCFLHQRMQALKPCRRKSLQLRLHWSHVEHRARCLLKMRGGRRSVFCLGVQSRNGNKNSGNGENANEASRSRFHFVFSHFAARIEGQLRRSLYNSPCRRRQFLRIHAPNLPEGGGPASYQQFLRARSTLLVDFAGPQSPCGN